MTTISATVDWVKDICWMNMVSVAQQKNKLYYIGGYSYLRSTSTPTRGGTALANSHIYGVDFSSTVNLEKNDTSFFTSVTRLPDLVPRISKGNFLWHESSLNFFGGTETYWPIFQSNGSFSLSDRVSINDTLFRHEISDGNTWTRNTSFDYDGTQPSPIGMTAKAFDDGSDNGKGVLWFYGGAYWQDQVKIGMETKGPKLDLVSFEDLWRIPGDCDPNNVVACRQSTTTSGNSTIPRGSLQATMVWVDNGSNGWLVLFGGTFRGDLVSMRYVHVYDIATSTWFMQATTAESDKFPADRIEACAVVAAAPDKSSYNIYVHGGYTGPSNNRTVSGGLWILTLPTFHWIRSPVGLENTKAEHTCVRIQNKFMVVHRGVGVLGDSDCDENSGFKIVDLVSLNWVTKIDVSGGDVVYQVPQLVSKAIGGNGTGGATYNSPQGGFSNPKLASLFNLSSTSPFTPNLGSSNTTAISSSSPSPSSSSPPSPSSVPKIIGGVLGGLIILILILSGILLLLRRRHKQLEQRVPPGELAATPGGMVEAPAQAPAMELPVGYWAAELPGGYGAAGDRKEDKKDSPAPEAGHYYAPIQTGPV